MIKKNKQHKITLVKNMAKHNHHGDIVEWLENPKKNNLIDSFICYFII